MRTRADFAEIERVYRRFAASVHRRCLRILRDETAAYDALQDVFVRVVHYGIDLSNEKKALACLYKMATRCCLTQLKDRRRRRELPVREEPEALADGRIDGRVHGRIQLRRFLHRLSRRQREVAVMYYVDEWTQEEIAHRLGCTRKTVYNDIRKIERRAERFEARLCWRES